MKTKTVDYQDDELSTHFVVRRGSILENLVREQMIQAAIKTEMEQPLDLFGQARRTAEIVVWPTLFAGTVEGVIADGTGMQIDWPISFDQFLDIGLPQDLINEWMQSIWDLNPGWEPEKPASDQERQAEKKG